MTFGQRSSSVVVPVIDWIAEKDGGDGGQY